YESTALEDISYPKRKDKEAWHYFEILECCNYFTRLGSTRTVTLLSPQMPKWILTLLNWLNVSVRIKNRQLFKRII
ncbi:Uncharacterized protein FKW44_013798, partial [Caligus rogercresseyi]